LIYTARNLIAIAIQVPVAPDGAGGNDEAGESPALSRNCDLVIDPQEVRPLA